MRFLLRQTVKHCTVQVWNDGNSEDEVLAMVARTGLRSTMGNMLRQATNPLHGSKVYQDPFLRVSKSGLP